MAQHLESPLLTLPDVARLARVQRPVVSVWRKRAANTEHPFPAPRGSLDGQELFDAHEVGAWLEATRRGKNPEALADADAFSIRSALDAGSERIADGLEALLVLTGTASEPIDTLTAAALLDEADDADPDDAFLWSELDALGDDLPTCARYARRLTDAAYNPAAAFEQLIKARRDRAASALSQETVALVASAAVELLAELGLEAALADPVPGSSELPLAVVRILGEGSEPRLLLADDGGDSPRAARRRLRVHGAAAGRLAVDEQGRFDVEGRAVVVAHLAGADPHGTLSSIENVALQMDDGQRAVVVAPARALTDALADRGAEGLRTDLLRTGRVRAIVRLPDGTLPARPREAQALWVLGPAHQDVPLADRWTMVADLGGRRLTRDVREDLVSDLAASMHGIATVRAHAFRFARLRPTPSLLASRGALVASAPVPAGRTPRPADLALRLEALLAGLGTDATGFLGSAVVPSTEAGTGPETLERLVASRHVRLVPGTRMDDAATSSAVGGTRVLGVPELTDPNAPRRTVDLLAIVAQHPGVRLTESGDVVFCTSPRPTAIVDEEGVAVVPYPARILRISAADPGGLSPALLAADINARPPGDRRWRQWRVRRLPEFQREPLAVAMRAVVRAQTEARERLLRLAELHDLLADAVASGALALEPTSPAREEGR